MVELNNEDALRFAIAAPQQKVGYQNITGIFGDMTTTAGYDPLRKSDGPKCCDAQHGFFNAFNDDRV
jgi:hypothetical protein